MALHMLQWVDVQPGKYQEGLRQLVQVLNRLQPLPAVVTAQPSAPTPSQVTPRLQKTKVQWMEEGNTHKEAKRFAEALAAYEHALELDPKYSFAWYEKGDALRSLQQYEEALAAYERALELDPKYSLTWIGKYQTLLILGRQAEAEQAFKRMLELR